MKLERIEPPRYRLLETTRDYARRRLTAAGEHASALALHGQVMRRRAEAMLEGSRAQPTLAEQFADYADLALAFDEACARDDGDAAAAFVAALRRLDQTSGRLFLSGKRMPQAQRMLTHAGPLGRARLFKTIASCGWARLPGLPPIEAARRAAACWREVKRPPPAPRRTVLSVCGRGQMRMVPR